PAQHVSNEELMHRITARLSDGREIIYYSGTGGTQPPNDRRGLDAHALTSEMRYDAPTGDWVIIAGHRQTRGLQRGADDGPPCPWAGGRGRGGRGGDGGGVVRESGPRARAVAGGDPAPPVHAELQPLMRSAPGAGRCEVICFSPQHDASFVELKTDR